MFKDKETFKDTFLKKIKNLAGKSIDEVTNIDVYKSLANMIKEEINHNWSETKKQYINNRVKQTYYFSIEYLPGKMLHKNLLSLGIYDICKEGLEELGFDLEQIKKEEREAGLGNGGLGRLASCFLDSLASLNYPGHGYGIRYKYGLFEQKIINGNQVELLDSWLNNEFVWEIRRPGRAVNVKFYGDVEVNQNEGEFDFKHVNYEQVKAVPYDVPVIGFDNNTVNTMRLWSAESVETEPATVENNRYQHLNYTRTVEFITQFLYPDDNTYEGKEMRLKQQYFLCSAGLQDIFKIFDKYEIPYSEFPDKISLHVNDTHPALLIPELMRILIDEKNLEWKEAWNITQNTVSYTNHTIMSEALETWPVNMFKNLLPRIYMITEEINKRFCRKLIQNYSCNLEKAAQMAIICDGQIKMAHLAIAGSHSVNGVSPLHTKILKENEMNVFYKRFPAKFNNKTNGITHRRWLLQANPALTDLLKNVIGQNWIYHPQTLIKILQYQDSESFQNDIKEVKQTNKRKLSEFIRKNMGININVNSIFDVHIKRIHGYKRQLLNILHVMYLYNCLKENPDLDMVPRTFIFAGKAASSYYLAKRIIKLINTVADLINSDKSINDKIKVVFLENYSVTLAEKIIPAADVSEQISTASKEASGTGNMKFMMNGALTLGTMDGANLQIYNMVGKENIYTFGLKADEVLSHYKNGSYSSRRIYYNDSRIKKLLEQLISGPLTESDENFETIYDFLLNQNDPYFILKDFDSYVETQEMIDINYRNQKDWLKKSIINIAHSGKFSSDSTISEYAGEIWGIRPLKIE
ncbi:MAG: glycogen/starch/alpha-glucan phosphorylase [Halanaerobiales bacterium]